MLLSIKGDAAATNQLGLGQTRAVEMLYVAHRIASEPAEQKSRWVARLREAIATTDRRTQTLYDGDPSLGVLPVSDARVLAGLREREDIWRTEIKPVLEQLIAARSSAEAGAARSEEHTS